MAVGLLSVCVKIYLPWKKKKKRGLVYKNYWKEWYLFSFVSYQLKKIPISTQFEAFEPCWYQFRAVAIKKWSPASVLFKIKEKLLSLLSAVQSKEGKPTFCRSVQVLFLQLSMKPVLADFDPCKTRADISFEMYLGIKNTEAIYFCQCPCYSQFLCTSFGPVNLCFSGSYVCECQWHGQNSQAHNRHNIAL